VFFKHRKNAGVAVYVPKGSILKEMAGKIEVNQQLFLT
jgi:hypothetical protein